MRGSLAIVMFGLFAASAGAQESLPLPAVAAIKDATVMIAITALSDSSAVGSGSGFLIRVEGQTAYVATNHHVVNPPGGRAAGGLTITVVLRSGMRNEQNVRGEIMTASSERDLAIIKITGVKDPPAPIDVLKETEPVETMPVHVFGFPFGKSLALGRGNPSVVVGKGSVSSVRRNPDGDVSSVLIDGALNPGNSGGPVVDTKGRLVGVAVAAILGANIGIAVPRRDLLAMLEGRPEALSITAITARDGAAYLTVGIPLLDPFDKIKEVTLLHDSNGAGAIKSGQPHRGASAQALSGAILTKLKIKSHQAEGVIAVAATPGKDIDLKYQIAYAGERGQTIYTKPGRYLFCVPRGAPSPASAGAVKAWGDVIDADGDCNVEIKNGELTVEVPGALHDVNAEIGKWNAPRVVQEVDGDFVVQVKVCGEFGPTGPSTRDDALPYQGAGLILWLDNDRYIRMERGAVVRDRRVGAFLLYERHDRGQAALKNNAFLEEGDVYLKIERRGSRLAGFYGTDGQQWAEAAPIEIKWPARLKVGLDAVNSDFSPLSVRFEGFSIRRQ